MPHSSPTKAAIFSKETDFGSQSNGHPLVLNSDKSLLQPEYGDNCPFLQVLRIEYSEVNCFSTWRFIELSCLIGILAFTGSEPVTITIPYDSEFHRLIMLIIPYVIPTDVFPGIHLLLPQNISSPKNRANPAFPLLYYNRMWF